MFRERKHRHLSVSKVVHEANTRNEHFIPAKMKTAMGNIFSTHGNSQFPFVNVSDVLDEMKRRK